MPLKSNIPLDAINPLLNQPLTYLEIINFLDTHWQKQAKHTLSKLNHALHNSIATIPTIVITGSHGNSETIHYLEELFKQKNITCGSLNSLHCRTYNERIKINGKAISNETFTIVANKILHIVHDLNLSSVSTKDILTAMSLLLFYEQKINAAIFQQDDASSRTHMSIIKPNILSIPHATPKKQPLSSTTLQCLLQNVKKHTFTVSADPSKLNLTLLAQQTEQQSGHWIMPIRKAAPLIYPFEQLYGKYAALAQRIVQIYDDQVLQKSTLPDTQGTTNKIYAHKTSFALHDSKKIPRWQKISNQIPNKFTLTTDNNLTLLLDNADNNETLNTLFLGARLLHYKKPFTSISIIASGFKELCTEETFIGLLKLHFKKKLTQLNIYQTSNVHKQHVTTTWDLNQLQQLAQYNKIPVTAYSCFATAYQNTLKTLQELPPASSYQQAQAHNHLVIITGSQEIVSHYYRTMQQ